MSMTASTFTHTAGWGSLNTGTGKEPQLAHTYFPTDPPAYEIARIQGYLRENARNHYESESLPPFTLFFHPSSPVKYFNYAIPDQPTGSGLDDTLKELRKAFRRRGRTARFEFFEAFAPLLPDELLKHGFNEEARQWSMVCTPENLCSEPEMPRLEVVILQSDSPAEDVRDYIIAQRQGFDPSNTAQPSDFDVVQARLDFLVSGWQAFLARIDGEPAGAASFSRPIDGVAEIAGIATREAFRRRGIATRLAWLATRMAFDMGVTTACLTANDEQSGRVYERLGYQPFSVMLAYIDGEHA